ncbi:MAG: cytochrome C oxidase subunit IV family protein [Planctomycetota bacterium]|nr:cytochrome C oxidase subunit IV family protein [Planctomycetota bacterium]
MSAQVRTYTIIFAILLALMGATIFASFHHIGRFNLALTMLIATIKAVLVVLFFMHVWDSPRLTWLTAGGSVVWLLILLGLTFTDYGTRDWKPNPLGTHPVLLPELESPTPQPGKEAGH